MENIERKPIVIIHDLSPHEFDYQKPSLDYYKVVTKRDKINCDIIHVNSLNGNLNDPKVQRIVLMVHNNFNQMLELTKNLITQKKNQLTVFSAFAEHRHRQAFKKLGIEMKTIPVPAEELIKACTLN